MLGSIVEGGGGAPPRGRPRRQGRGPKAAAARPPPLRPPARAPPRTRPGGGRLAAESGVDPSRVAGCGKDGRVTKGDMLAAIATGALRRPASGARRAARPPRRTMPRARSA